MGGRLSGLLLRDVEVAGRRVDVQLVHGLVAEIGIGLTGGDAIEGRGGALIPGLIDHHLHLLATASALDSVSLAHAVSPAAVDEALRIADAAAPPGRWLRATGFHEHRGGPLDRARLDRLVPERPVRVQHQTGSVWLLNSAALVRLDLAGAPPGFDSVRGRLERGDAWLRAQIGDAPPDLVRIGRLLSAAGVTGVCDASVTNDAGSAALIAAAQASGALPQRVMMMSGGPLDLPGSARLVRGPTKILLDDHALPPLEEVIARIAEARMQGRRVAVHCVAAGELAMTLAAFAAAGAQDGDRIEHGGVIPQGSIAEIATLGLTVVTQPGFVAERGDRYLAEVERYEQPDLYRCASLIRAGVRVAASSDAPYGPLDPWAGMRAAVARRTAKGRAIGADEAIAPDAALGLYLGGFADPGGAPRRIAPGAAADLCLLDAPLHEVLRQPSADRVRITLVAGEPVFSRGRPPIA